MSGCDFDALESLAAGELAPELVGKALSHAADCPACARELALLRKERAAFADRARDSAPLPGFAAALALSRWSVPEAPAPKAPPPAARPSFPWAVSAFGVAAAAAFAGLFLVPPGGAPRIEEPAERSITAEPASEDLCHDEAFYTGITSAPRSPNACEMPAVAVARATATADTTVCGSCAPEPDEGIVTCGHDSCVTEPCSSPLHN
jgi:hypothetical protein